MCYVLSACNQKAEILPLATALTANLRCLCNQVFALLICLLRSTSFNFTKISLKLSYFCKTNYKIS